MTYKTLQGHKEHKIKDLASLLGQAWECGAERKEHVTFQYNQDIFGIPGKVTVGHAKCNFESTCYSRTLWISWEVSVLKVK